MDYAETTPLQHSLLDAQMSSTPSRELQLKTPQSLVHISHIVTEVQTQLWMLICATYLQMYEHSPEEIKSLNPCWIRINRSSLSKLFKYDIGFQNLEQHLEVLRKAALTFNLIQKDGADIRHGMGFISEWKVHANYIAVQLPSHVREAIHQESKQLFSLIRWSIYHGFPGKYEQIIYKLCNDLKYIGKTDWFEPHTSWRRYCGIDKPDAKTNKMPFSSAADLIRYTITGPLKRINDTPECDLTIETEEIRVRRQLIRFRFVFKVRNAENSYLPNYVFDKAGVKLPESLKLHAASTLAPEQLEMVLAAANAFIEKCQRTGQPYDAGKIYYKAIHEKWGVDKAVAPNLVEKKEKEVRSQRLRKEREERLEGLKKKFILVKNNELRSAITPEMMDMIAADFATAKEVDFAREYDLDKHDFTTQIQRLAFKQFIADTVRYEFNADEFDAWVKDNNLA